MEDIAVFLPEGAVADEGRKTEVEELSEGTGLRVVFVGGSDAIKAADDVRELLMEDALEIGVFLVGAYYVWSCSEGVIEA